MFDEIEQDLIRPRISEKALSIVRGYPIKDWVLAITKNTNVNVDTNRIMTTGDSAGGYVILLVGLNHSREIRAVTASYPLVDSKSRHFTKLYEKPMFGFSHLPVSLLYEHEAKLKAQEIPSIVSADPQLARASLMFCVVQNARYAKFFPNDQRDFSSWKNSRMIQGPPEAFDDAFISRIHVIIRYDNLSADSRRKIWSHFFDKLDDEREDFKTTQRAKDYVLRDGEISKMEWNGREMCNAVALAEFRFLQNRNSSKTQPTLDQKDFEQVLNMMQQFKTYLHNVHGLNEEERAYKVGSRAHPFSLPEQNC
ncbi:hypothetical protein N0V84_004828 [Fusarium piperis]|uniref:AAA+ ATPase lid domain-containing protein n=1 Tax=Fusarium piperis TaxID=1435070 RepID=A0A9W9BR63_9HYPO|nr:hypothetical protein N0V84_004828 [Fusarium piperis]